MHEQFINERNLRFLLYEVQDAESLTCLPYFEDQSREIFDMVLETALRIGRDLLAPCLQEMDEDVPRYQDGRVSVHPVVRTFMEECGKGGWIAANASYETGGQQLPATVTGLCTFIFSAANYSASVFPLLTQGAANLIESFGSPKLRDTYVPNLLAGRWQGTMALTEPQAGSSLSDILTRAEPALGGFYHIRGQKIFISAGDHDGVENVVHLLLARIPESPEGVKGISLFVVPKMRPHEDGTLGTNDVNTTGIYHKLGYRGCPITQLNFGENGYCRGYLVGKPNEGLTYMFQMMNEARLQVGMGAAGIASAAFHTALRYTRERLQGRPLSMKHPGMAQVPLIQHPDVKRMLLFQRSVVEGSLSLLLQCYSYMDRARAAAPEGRERFELLLDLLTPVVKTYPSEMGILCTSQAIQCLGGYGYCNEFPAAQFFRDMRIHPIHEGTTGIHAMDLLGRKVTMRKGKALRFFMEEVSVTVQNALQDDTLAPFARRLADALEILRQVTSHRLGMASAGGVEAFLSDATLYLELFGIIAVAWHWLVQGLAVQKGLKAGASDAERTFYLGKLFALRYFFHYELAKSEGLRRRLLETDAFIVGMDPILLGD